jgi:hypothetical protein
VRADLLALTPEAVASLSNLGLVKRATKELEAGQGPAFAEAPDGTVTGKFPDGVETKLPAGVSLKDALCSCGARGVCRHRVAVALGYKAWHGKSAAPTEPWWPGELDDAALERALGAKRIARAQAAMQGGVLVTLEPGAVPAARLATCSVRFLVPHDFAYAQCDCVEQSACEHVALAVWAFRLSRGAGPVALGGASAAAAKLDDFAAISDSVLELGVARTPALAARFAGLRKQAADAGHVWLETLLADLEQQLDGWRARSALATVEEIRALLVELEARLRAAGQGGELPQRYVLGSDEAAQTLLDHVRLVSLGARLLADGETRFADVFLFDPDSGAALVLRKRWDSATEVGPELARRTVAPKVPLQLIATGQVVSKAVVRRANRAVELGSSRVNQTSVTPQSGDWSLVRPPVRIEDLAAWYEHQRSLPPRVLRPRVLAEHLHVIEVGRVVDVVSVPSEQTVVAVLEDKAGHRVRAIVRHRSVAPHALQAAAAAFAEKVKYVSGELELTPHGAALEVLAISTGERVIVPDLCGPATPPPLETARGQLRADGLAEVLRSTESVLDELLMSGLSSPDAGARKRLGEVAASADEHGLSAMAKRLAALDEALKAGKGEVARAAWRAAGVRVSVLRECREG